jgi:YggT family protein
MSYAISGLISLVQQALQLYIYLVIASAILSWLMAFNVVNPRNEVVRSIWRFLDAVTEPALRPIRKILPNLGGVDISPVLLIFIISAIQILLGSLVLSFRSV